MTRDFTSVGVIGLGTMGAGIVEVFARNGIDVIAVEVDEAGIEHGKQVLAGIDRAGPGPRQDDPGRVRRAARPGHLHQRPRRPGRLPARGRGGARAPRPQEGAARQGGRRGVAGGGARDEHLLPAGDRDRRRHVEPQAGRRHALLQPGAGAAVRRGHPHGDHRRRRLRGRQGARRAARQEAGHRRRQGGVHRQRPALRLPQPRRVDVREPLRDPRGPRRRHAVRLRLPDGPARAARPDRSRHGLRDPRHDVQAGPQPAARPSPIIKQMVSAGLLGRKSGRGFYTYAEPGSPEVVADAQTPAGGLPRRGVAAAGGVGGRGRVGDHGDRHHRGVRARPGTPSPTSPAATTRSAGVRAAMAAATRARWRRAG